MNMILSVFILKSFMNAEVCGQGQYIKLYIRAVKIDRCIAEDCQIPGLFSLYSSQRLTGMLVQNVLMCIMIFRFS